VTLLRYLVFDYSEDAQGHGSFDAMASASAAQRADLEAEVAAVLGWAHRTFPEGLGPPEEGGEWDFSLQGLLETPQTLAIDFDPGAQTLRVHAGAPAPPRTTFDFTLSGSPAFCSAFGEAFHIDRAEP
jgi:hypothetical protein